MTRSAPVKKRIVEHFDSTVNHWSALYGARAGWNSYNDKQYRFNYVAGMVPPGPGFALDVGCGAGQFLIHLENLNYRSVGVEISVPMAATARLHLQESQTRRARVILGDCENLPCPDASVDLYVAMGVIEYQSSDDLMLDECARVLKPRGVGVITARNSLCPAVRWKMFYEDRALRAAARIVSPLRQGRMPERKIPISREHEPADLKRVLRRRGMDILAERFSHFYVLPHPFSRTFRSVEHFLAKRLECLSATALGMLGSTYIVKFQKRG